MCGDETPREGCKDVSRGPLTCCPKCPSTPEARLLCTVVQVGHF